MIFPKDIAHFVPEPIKYELSMLQSTNEWPISRYHPEWPISRCHPEWPISRYHPAVYSYYLMFE